MPSVILCADDFAMSRGTSRVIAELAQAGCINAISCMAAAEGWPDDAPMLAGFGAPPAKGGKQVQVGLHLVLASERPLGPMACTGADGRLPGPDSLLARALAGRLDLGEFAAEIDRQFAAFRAATGNAPDFVDGHQHVHVIPGIRQLVIAATLRHAPHSWVRVPADGLQAMLRRPFSGKAIGSALHSLGLASALRRKGLAANASFAGHYDFGDSYADFLPRFFTGASSCHLIMCHPGSDDGLDDPIAQARVREAAIIGQMTLAQRLEQLGKGAGHV